MKNYVYRMFFLSAVLCGGLLGLFGLCGSLGSLKFSPAISSLSSNTSTNIATELSSLVPTALLHATSQVNADLPLGLPSGANTLSPAGALSLRSGLSAPYNTLKETVTLAEHNESSCCSWWNSVGKIIVLIFATIAYTAGGWYLITRKHNN